MAQTDLDVRLRPATIDDAPSIADLDTVREPDDPRDPVLMRHWWKEGDQRDLTLRLVAECDGKAVAFVAAGHTRWTPSTPRYGWLRPRLHPDLWTPKRFAELMAMGEAWLRGEGVETFVYQARDYLRDELQLVRALGYEETRVGRISELDLEEHRDDILREAAASRRAMAAGGIELVSYGDCRIAGKARGLYELEIEAEGDIPTTVPIPVMPFEQWSQARFSSPTFLEDRVWLATDGDAIVGMSQVGYPVVRGIPHTEYTATARRVRGRGIGRALKYQTMAQAIELGFSKVRTQNDGENEPILRINREMGYRLVFTQVELHREVER